MSNHQFSSNFSADAIREAALTLQAGHLVAFPTETVYGLGADARNPEAVKRVYEVKGRPTDHPLIVHISSIDQLDKWAIDIPEYAITLARKFWPGPMTLILKRSGIAGDFITGGQSTIGLRVPSDPVAIALISEFEKISNSAIAAPSANRFSQVSPTSSLDVQEEIGEYLSSADRILDGGNSSIGIESTIIDCTSESPRILRSGYVTLEAIKHELGILIHKVSYPTEIRFSGSLEKHYAPKCKVVLEDRTLHGAGFLALEEIETPLGMVRLASPGTVEEFAKVLYAVFREADRKSLECLVVSPPKAEGLGVAIMERLEKATQGRH